MDIVNNKAGTEFVVNKSKSGNPLELDEIEREALLQLKSGRLNILSPSDKKIPDGYYSK